MPRPPLSTRTDDLSNLFEAMVREDDDAKRGELRARYLDAVEAKVAGERIRRTAAPRMALRRHHDGSMDDVVVERPSMFRAEQLSENNLWLCCYFDDYDRITFNVGYDRKAKTLVYDVGELPDEWIDIDRKRAASAS